MTDRLLPCGHDPTDVWDHAGSDVLTSHEQTCPYCQGVVSEFHVLSDPTRVWQAEPLDAPTALLERVLSTVRSSLRARTYFPLVSPHGPVQLDTTTAAAVLRWVVDQVDGARARTCAIEAVDLRPAPAHPGDPPPDPIVAVSITIAVRSRSPAHRVADEARQLVRAVSRELLGLDVVSVDINVVDLYL